MGRGRAPIPDMIKRTATIEDQFPPLGNMDGIKPRILVEICGTYSVKIS